MRASTGAPRPRKGLREGARPEMGARARAPPFPCPCVCTYPGLAGCARVRACGSLGSAAPQGVSVAGTKQRIARRQPGAFWGVESTEC